MRIDKHNWMSSYEEEIMSDQNELTEALGAFMSRRKMIQLIGMGTVGALAAPKFFAHSGERARKVVAGGPTDAVWEYTLPSTLAFAADPIFYKGTVIICAQPNDGFGGFVYCIDSQTKQELWAQRFEFPTSDFQLPVVANGVIYIVNQDVPGPIPSTLYAITANTGELIWSYDLEPGSETTIAGGKFFYWDGQGRVTCVNLDTRATIWTRFYADAAGPGTSLDVFGSYLVLRNATNLLCLNSNDGTGLWSITAASGNEGSDLTPDIVNGLVYYMTYDANNNGTLNAVDLGTGVHKWTTQPTTGSFTAPLYYAGKIYLGSANGNIYVRDPNTGAAIGEPIAVSPGAHLDTTPIFIEDGVAYATADFFTQRTAKYFAVDLTGQTAPAQYDPQTFGSIFGVETGVCYGLAGNTKVIAVRLAELIHEFFTETELMAEDYVRNGSVARPNPQSTPTYRTHIQIFDPNRNARANKSVRVWASGPVTLTVAGQTLPIDINDPVWIQTDSTGELSIVSTIPSDTSASFTTPALYLWGNFMDLNEAMVIYPDHDTLTKFAATTGPGLTSATGYDGNPLLPATAAGAAPAIASMVNNLLGSPTASLAGAQTNAVTSITGRQLGTGPNTYMAYPGSTTNLTYQPVAGSTARPLVVTGEPSWTATFGADGNGTPAYTPTAGPLPRIVGSTSASIFTHIDDFVNRVVRGAAKVAKVVYRAVGSITHEITDSLGNAYHLAVHTLEDAVKVLNGIFKTIANGLKRALEWLSYVFDWSGPSGVLATKRNLEQTLMTSFNNLKTIVDTLIGTEIIKHVRQFFQGAENTIAGELDLLRMRVGATSPTDWQYQQNNPQAIFGMSGAKSYTKSKWLMSVFKENAAKTTVPLNPADRDANLVGTEAQNFHNDLNGPGGILSDPMLQELPASFQSALTELFDLATNPSSFTSTTLTKFFDAFEIVAVDILKLADLAVERVLRFIQKVFDSILNVMKKPIDIPIISSLYQIIAGAALSPLDLICLVVAIPVSIISNATTAAGRVMDCNGVLTLTTIIVGLAFATFDGMSDLTPDLAPLAAQIALATTNFALLLCNLGDVTDASASLETKYFYALQFFPVVVTCVGFIFMKFPGTFATAKVIYDLVARIANCAYGITMEVISAVLGARQVPGFWGSPRGYILAQNVITFFPSVMKPLGTGADDLEPQAIALSVVDWACDATGLTMLIANRHCTP